MKKIYCDSCGKEISFDNSFEHWNKVVVTEIDEGRTTVPSTEAYDICRVCWNRIKRENFEKENPLDQFGHEIKRHNCEKCGCQIIGEHKNNEGKILCTTCKDKEEWKPDTSQIETMEETLKRMNQKKKNDKEKHKPDKDAKDIAEGMRHIR